MPAPGRPCQCDNVRPGEPWSADQCVHCWAWHNAPEWKAARLGQTPPHARPSSATTMASCKSCPGHQPVRIHRDMPVELLVAVLQGPAPAAGWPDDWEQWPVTEEAHRRLADPFVAEPHLDYPGGLGRGIVTCGGGPRYFVAAWIMVSVLRRLGCTLPVEWWYLGPREMDPLMIHLAESLGDVSVRDAVAVGNALPDRPRWLGGWESKIFGLLYSSFEECLFLDADQIPLLDPTYLFDEPAYREHGTVLWPDPENLGTFDVEAQAFRTLRLPVPSQTDLGGYWKPTGYRPVESGQVLLHRLQRWHELCLAWHLAEHADYWYRNCSQGKGKNLLYGDKSLFFLAWERLGQHYRMPSQPPDWKGSNDSGALMQKDFQHRVVFQHRCQPRHKYHLHGPNQGNGLGHWAWVEDALARLRERWGSGRVEHLTPPEWKLFDHFSPLTYKDVVSHNEYRLPARFPPGSVILDVGANEGAATRACLDRGAMLVFSVEPNPDLWPVLEHNVGHDARVRIVRGAAWPHPAELYLGLPEGFSHSGSQTVMRQRGRPVQGISFDNLVKQAAALSANGRLTLLKMDCEGAEFPCLLNSAVLNLVDAIAGEYHLAYLNPGQSLDRLVTALKQDGLLVGLVPKTSDMGNFFAVRPTDRVLYTALFSGRAEPYDELLPVKPPPGWTCLCFSDRMFRAEGWFVVPLKGTGRDPRRDARRVKCLAHHFLPWARQSLWIDANVQLTGDAVSWAEAVLVQDDLAAWENRHYDCTYQDAQAVVAQDLDAADVVEAQMARYRQGGLEENAGLVYSGVLARRHTPAVNAFNEAWWREIQLGSARDQLSFIWAARQTGLNWRKISGDLGDSADFQIHPHRPPS